MAKSTWYYGQLRKGIDFKYSEIHIKDKVDDPCFFGPGYVGCWCQGKSPKKGKENDPPLF